MDRSLQFFDGESELQIVDRRLPHWSQAGTVCFLTWRTKDSMPSHVLDRWFSDRDRKLAQVGIDASDPRWNEKLRISDPTLAKKLSRGFWNRWHDDLDSGHGACELRKPELAEIVADSLRHFDGERYLLFDFVVMPNHVHVLMAFSDEDSMLTQCESWKHFTATQINRKLGRRGRFWQQDGLDHLVRSEEQFVYLRSYIAGNPNKAGLRIGEFKHFSKSLAGS